MQSEKEFLATYDITKYPRPSVTVDDVIFAFDGEDTLKVLLIKRNDHPFKDKWALPGGFVHTGNQPSQRESLDEAAKRELKEETHISSLWSEQLYTYGNTERDPRGHIISVAYIGAVPTYHLPTAIVTAGDDARDAQWFDIRSKKPLRLRHDHKTLNANDLAFDHATIISDAIERIAGKILWTDIATHFVADGNTFTLPQLRKLCETFLSINNDRPAHLDPGNFHRDYRRWLDLVPDSARKGPNGASLYTRRKN